jgi:DnaJ-class molecular chaperone
MSANVKEEPTYYDTLQVSSHSTLAEIKNSYRKLAKQLHPDKNGGNDIMFKVLQQAYETLYDPIKRHQYNLTIHFNALDSKLESNTKKTESTTETNSVEKKIVSFDSYQMLDMKSLHVQINLPIVINQQTGKRQCKYNITYNKRHTCTDCLGTGICKPSRVSDSTTKNSCNKCFGKRGKFGTRQGELIYVPCDGCNGYGFNTFSQHKCKTCNGSRQLDIEVLTKIKIYEEDFIQKQAVLESMGHQSIYANTNVFGDLIIFLTN